MSVSKDGGPAFPFEFDEHQVDGPPQRMTHAGMSLRDYFAAKAMQAFAAQLSEHLVPESEAGALAFAANNIARLSYFMADAMLQARGRE